MNKKIFSLTAGLALLLTSCQARPMMPNMLGAQSMMRQPMQAMTSLRRAPGDLVGVEGFVSGDRLKVKGPFFTSGKGQIHALTPDTFRIEFQIVNYHLIVEATRLDATKVKFVTIDVKAGRTVEAIGNYTRTGNTTVFDMGPGQEVEKLTVRGIKAGNFEADVVQPGRLFPTDDRGSNTLKFSKE